MLVGYFEIDVDVEQQHCDGEFGSRECHIGTKKCATKKGRLTSNGMITKLV
ncbi:hypothetical protein Mapa_011946 [Marchantia paleacea]|nr:hypothetical protein Mapa_011946 [Marchantia paleacea]